MKREVWAEIQDGEFDYHGRKDEAKVLEYKLPYWRDLLAALPSDVRFGAGTRTLDIGCGGASVLLAIAEGHKVGLDPLIDRYVEKFPYMRDRTDIDWVQGAAEEVEFEKPFDVIFAINSFDHVYDPAMVVDRIAGWLAPGGHCVVTMNTHNTMLFRNYYRTFYRVIDHHHPFQFVRQDVQDLFRGFDCEQITDIDDLWIPYMKGWYEQVLHRAVEDKRKWARAALNPFKWPMGFAKFALGMPPHRKRLDQKRSIYSECLYVFRLPLTGRRPEGTPAPTASART